MKSSREKIRGDAIGAARGRRRALALLATLAAGGSGIAGTAPRLRLAVTHVPPWGTLDAAGHAGGVMVELAALLQRASGVTITPSVLPYPRAIDMMERGAIDLMFAVDTPRLRKVAEVVGTLAEEDVVLLYRADQPLRSAQDLHGKTVGRLRYAAYAATLQADSAIHFHDVDTHAQGLQMLLRGRLDALLSVRSSLAGAVHELAPESGSEAGAEHTTLAEPLVLEHTHLLLFAARRSPHWPLAAQLAPACAQLYRQHSVQTLLAARNLSIDHL